MTTYCVQGHEYYLQELLPSTSEGKCSDNPGIPMKTILNVLRGAHLGTATWVPQGWGNIMEDGVGRM